MPAQAAAAPPHPTCAAAAPARRLQRRPAMAAAALDPQALARFEAGLDGLAENDLMDEAEVDSIVREAVLHAVGDAPWADSKARAGMWLQTCLGSGPAGA